MMGRGKRLAFVFFLPSLPITQRGLCGGDRHNRKKVPTTEFSGLRFSHLATSDV